MPGPHKGASTQHHNQQVLAKPRHQPSERDQQAREKLRQKAKIKSHAYILGSNCKVAPFIKGAAPTCNCKLEHPFIKAAAPTVKVHLAPFINGATCSIYKESSSNFKFQSKI